MRIKGMITKGEHRPVLNQFFQTRFISAWGKKKPTYFKHRVFLVSYLGLACKDIQFFCYKDQNKVYIPLHYLNVPPIHLWILQGFHTVLLHGKFSSLPQLSRQTIIQWKFLKYILNSFHGFKSPRCLLSHSCTHWFMSTFYVAMPLQDKFATRLQTSTCVRMICNHNVLLFVFVLNTNWWVACYTVLSTLFPHQKLAIAMTMLLIAIMHDWTFSRQWKSLLYILDRAYPDCTIHLWSRPVIKTNSVQYLKQLITDHLSKFKELFPNANVLPKQYYLIDIPSTITLLGPMVRSSCFSFESAHSYFKKLARKQNFKNSPLSQAKRHQFNECCNFGDSEENPSSHPLFSNEKTCGVTEKADPERCEVWFLWSTTWNQIGQRHACIQGELDHTS